MEKVTIGNATLYCGDCRIILPQLDTADLLLTDPPYGIGEDGGLKARYRKGDGRVKGIAKHEKMEWDTAAPEEKDIKLICSAAEKVMICGGNYFAQYLENSQGWLYWCKNIGGDFSDGELIYTNMKMGLREFRLHPFSGLRGGKDRVHPTQKPVELMEWCLSFVPDAITVLDPYMGSGTTGVACEKQGKHFIGIERERKYFDIACQRIERENAQLKLFAPKKEQRKATEQSRLF